MGEHGRRKADEANEYLKTEGMFRIRNLRDAVENLTELIKLREADGKHMTIRPRVKLPDFTKAA